MNRKVSMAVFALVAVAVIIGGIRYTERLEGRRAAEADAEREVERENQRKIMESLKIEDVRAGTGAEAKNGDMLTVHYEGKLDDGTVFDSSYGREPFTLTLGRGDVIRGWELGLLGMKAGGKRQLTIPPELGYGPNGYGPIPPNAALHFTVELLKIGNP